MTHDIHAHRLLILDFGSQYSQLIARRVRELGVYCELRAFDMTDDEIRAFNPKGIILSGGPESVTEAGSPRAPESVFTLGVPVLGICYGMQTMAEQLGGRVEGLLVHAMADTFPTALLYRLGRRRVVVDHPGVDSDLMAHLLHDALLEIVEMLVGQGVQVARSWQVHRNARSDAPGTCAHDVNDVRQQDRLVGLGRVDGGNPHEHRQVLWPDLAQDGGNFQRQPHAASAVTAVGIAAQIGKRRQE